MTRAVALIALLLGGCTARPLVVPGPGDGSRDFSLVDRDLAGADLVGADLAGLDLAGADLAGDDLAGTSGADMQPVPLPKQKGASVGTGIVVLAADLDGDGDADLVVVEAAGTVRIYNGNGKGALFPRQAFEINTNTALATGVLADVDADGVLDLVLAENGSKSEVDVLRGNGDATFADWARIQITGGVSAVAVGDLNGDGVPDVVATTQDDLLHVLQGHAGGKPGLTLPTYAVGHGTTSIGIADVDGDGHLDVVTVDHGGGTLTCLKGDGALGFPTIDELQTASAPSGLEIVDWNLDGRPDVAVTGLDMIPHDVLVEVSYGDLLASETMSEGVSAGLTTSSAVNGLAAGDMDGDGRPDLVVSSDGSARIVIEYAGTFSAMPTGFTTDEGATSLALADFDNDGHLDVAAAGATRTQLYLTQP